MTRIALVTGASGQDARYLMPLLHKRGYTVHAQSRMPPPNIGGSSTFWHTGDPAEFSFLEQLIADIRPAEIYNLAAVSRPTLSWKEPHATAQINALLPQSICEIILKWIPACRFFQASSSDIFGDASSEQQDENTYCEPQTPYAVAKLYAHRIVGVYRRQYGLYACSGILFNHESPYRPLSFVSQKIAYAAAAVSLGMSEAAEMDERGKKILSGGKVALGNLSVRRDFGFAGDYVEAMHALLQQGIADDYVIGTGRAYTIQQFCEVAFRTVGLDWQNHVDIDPELFRKSDSRNTLANITKLRSAVDWRPGTSFEELVSLMVSAQIDRFNGKSSYDLDVMDVERPAQTDRLASEHSDFE